MEALVLIFVLAIVFIILSGVLSALWWVFKIFFKIGCFFAGMFLIGFIFLFMMIGCMAAIIK